MTGAELTSLLTRAFGRMSEQFFNYFIIRDGLDLKREDALLVSMAQNVPMDNFGA